MERAKSEPQPETVSSDPRNISEHIAQRASSSQRNRNAKTIKQGIRGGNTNIELRRDSAAGNGASLEGATTIIAAQIENAAADSQ